jgi:antitoxin component YwqK of YwqJK toxin-antitoxin module
MKLKEIKTYYDNDILHQHYFVNENNGKKEGKYKNWWCNGQLFIISYYKNGFLDGEYKVWNKDGGKLWINSYYKNGKVVGEHKTFYKNGNLCRLHNLKNGKIFGIGLDFFNMKL